jgi:two-component system, LytTR family, response regulator
MNVIIIDDEAPARARIRRLLAVHSSTVSIVGEAANGMEAHQLIDSLKPDVVFLDIQMPGLNGFEVLKKVKHIPVVVFTTAFDQYALQAFETNSVDYLLKPIEADRLAQTIAKIERFTVKSDKEQIEKFIELAEKLKPQKEVTAFPVKSGDTIHLVRLCEVAYIEAKDKYVTLHTLTGKEYLTDVSLKTMEEKLPANFVRVHRAFTINQDHLLEISKYFQGRFILKMNNRANTKITSGSTYSESIKEVFGI